MLSWWVRHERSVGDEVKALQSQAAAAISDDVETHMEKTSDRAKDAAHSASADKAKGRAEEVMGTVKSKLGHMVGDHKLEAKGDLQHAEGKKDRAKGEIKQAMDDVKDKVKATVEVVKEKVSDAHHR